MHFAVQNFEKTAILDAQISWAISRGNSKSKDYAELFNSLDLKDVNSSRTGTQFLSLTSWRLEGIEDTWTLSWLVRARNCSGTPPVDSRGHLVDPKLSGYMDVYDGSNITFTTKKGAAQPDYGAYTDSGACHETDGVTFNITGTAQFNDVQYKENTCPVLSETVPSPNPCAVEIDNKTASGINFTIRYDWLTTDCSEYASVDDCRKAREESRATLRFFPPTWSFYWRLLLGYIMFFYSNLAISWELFN